MKSKKGLFFGIGLLISTQLVVGAQDMERIYSKGTLLMDQESKRVLYENHGYDQMPMASTTKIMTCILALENNALDEVVTATSRAARAPKVKLGLQVDEKQTLGDLLYSLMMESHNDSAVAIAEHVGGSVENFCQMMTDKAKALGANSTSFETPNGLDGESHYSTPYDMALITAYALENPKFIEITNTLDKQIPSEPLKGSKVHQLINKNRFIREYGGAIGVKTGYTSKAGHCFVGAADKEGMKLIGVALGAGCDKPAKSRKYTDVKKMLNYGYANYDPYQVVGEGEEVRGVTVKKGKEEQVMVVYEDRVVVPLTEEETQAVYVKLTLPETLTAPIAANEAVGEAQVVCGDEVIMTTKLLAKDTIEKATLKDYIRKLFNKK
ncbi:MAG: D-alanyl-D-alanine carboxypeptidase family protein [Cellulosilyticaceae bacterium]